jgi:hypothetical protein
VRPIYLYKEYVETYARVIPPAHHSLPSSTQEPFSFLRLQTTPSTMTAQEDQAPADPTLNSGDQDDHDDDHSSDGEIDPNATPGTKSKKRKERLEQNRISARESRKRKKTMIEELQRTVITLSRENKDLNERNEQLRSQLMEIGTKVS